MTSAPTGLDLQITSSIPGKFAVERYPALKYLPSVFAPWKAQVLEQRQKDIKLYTELMDEVRGKVARGVAPDCFAKHVLQEQENLGMTDIEIAYTIGSPFGAGVETVWRALAPRITVLTLRVVCRISCELLPCMCQVWP